MPEAALPDFRAAPARRDEAWSGDHPIVVCFGDRCLRGRLRKFVRGLNTEPVFTLAFSLSDLVETAPDLVTVVRVYTGGVPEAPVISTLIFTGYVESLVWQNAEATVLASPMVALKTQRLGGLSVFGISPGELMWTFARLGGFSAAEIKIGDVWPPATEEFFVVAPIDGVDLEFAEQVGDVTFTPDEGLRRQWKAGRSPVDPSGSEYLTEFRSTKVAAVTTVRAALVLEAEQIGVSRIQAAASRLALASRRSLPFGTSGKPRPYTRSRLRERVRIRRVIGVLAKNSERQWIRGLDNWQDDSAVAADALRGMQDALVARLDDRTAETIGAWRRAALSTEPASAVVALAESLEFYVAGTSVPSLFSADDLAVARRVLHDGRDWTEEQRGRLDEVVSKANDAPFFIRLRAAVAQDGLVLTEAEFGLLRKMRDQRNDLLHGKERVDPTPDDLTAAVALVGRLLTARLAKLPRPS